MLLQPPKTTKFDPDNKEHRVAVHSFMKRFAWGDSPIRFAHDPAYSSVVEMVQHQLLAWYLAREVAPPKVKKVKKPVAVVANPKVSQLKKKA